MNLRMLAGFLLVAALTSGCTSARVSAEKRFAHDFETDAPGVLPPGWTQDQLGEGTTRWAVVPFEGGQVLAQLAAPNPNKHFNLAVLESPMLAEVTLSVRFRAVAGEHDQGGGSVWRYQDARNHYILRANPLENNVVLYKVQHGLRSDLPLVGAGRTYGVKVDPLGNDWHTLGLQAAGDWFTVTFDGRELFQVRDSTFTQPGRVGLWTKADAVTEFDDFVGRGR